MEFFQKELDAATIGIDKNLKQELAQIFRKKQWTIATVESTTGGEIAWHLTRLSEASPPHVGGFICKSPLHLIQWIGVSPATLRQYGEASEEVAKEIISGLQKRIKSDIYLTSISRMNDTHSDETIGKVSSLAIGYTYKTDERFKVIPITGIPENIQKQTIRSTLMYLKQWLSSHAL
jgi:nicotinamide-nucleotide amidase